MPVITVKIGKTDTKKKKELIEKLTKTAVDVTAISEGAFLVFIEEYDFHNIGVGGQSLADKMAGQ